MMSIDNYNDVEIFEKKLNDKGSKIAILCGGLNQMDPKGYMDEVVSNYVGCQGYNEFIEEPLDNPWLRVIIFGINDIKFKPYEAK